MPKDQRRHIILGEVYACVARQSCCDSTTRERTKKSVVRKYQIQLKCRSGTFERASFASRQRSRTAFYLHELGAETLKRLKRAQPGELVAAYLVDTI